MLDAEVPQTVSDHLALIAADTIAIAFGARANGVGATQVDRPEPFAGSVSVWGGEPAPALDAAFFNGTAAEALDFQEVLIEGRNNGHAAVVVVPALLALAEARTAPGERLCRALWIAMAANVILARTLGRGHRAGEVGFRTTSLTAPIAAALGAGFLLSDDPAVAANAAAIAAASLPAGLLAAMSPAAGDFSVDKDLSVGFSARHALHCAILAEAGATGPSNALIGPRSWLASYGFGTADADALASDPLGVDILAYALKFFPANFGCQCAIRLAIEVGRKLDPERVKRVEVRVKTSSAASLSTRDLTTHVAARFSLPYAVASAFLRRRSILADFEGDGFADAAVLAFMDRVSIEADDALETRHRSEGIFPAQMSVTMDDGSVESAALDRPQQGLERAEIGALFAQKVKSLCPPALAGRLLAVCAGPTKLQDFAAFISL